MGQPALLLRQGFPLARLEGQLAEFVQLLFQAFAFGLQGVLVLLSLDQGLLVMMIENHRSGMIWELLRHSPYIREGLGRAGFTGGWLAS